MDSANYRDLLRRAPEQGRAKVCMLLEPCGGGDVPDPYYGGAQGFETVLDLLEDGCASLLEHVRQQVDR